MRYYMFVYLQHINGLKGPRKRTSDSVPKCLNMLLTITAHEQCHQMEGYNAHIGQAKPQLEKKLYGISDIHTHAL